MIEFGVENYKGCDQFKAPEHISRDLKPILLFQGEPFENSDKHKRIRNLLLGMSFTFSNPSLCRLLPNLGHAGD
jgi:hypothetical protein